MNNSAKLELNTSFRKLSTSRNHILDEQFAIEIKNSVRRNCRGEFIRTNSKNSIELENSLTFVHENE